MVVKTIKQMKEELKKLIDECKLMDYKVIFEKGLIKIGIITEDFEKYEEKRIVNQLQA